MNRAATARWKAFRPGDAGGNATDGVRIAVGHPGFGYWIVTFLPHTAPQYDEERR